VPNQLPSVVEEFARGIAPEDQELPAGGVVRHPQRLPRRRALGRLQMGPISPGPCPRRILVRSAHASGEDNDLVQEGIEGTAHVIPGRRLHRWGLLRPVCAVPRPSVIRPKATQAAEEDNAFPPRVKRRNSGRPRIWSGGGIEIFPVRSGPPPGDVLVKHAVAAWVHVLPSNVHVSLRYLRDFLTRESHALGGER
jgi:hypothetical protein